jgi:hypothetical protein
MGSDDTLQGSVSELSMSASGPVGDVHRRNRNDRLCQKRTSAREVAAVADPLGRLRLVLLARAIWSLSCVGMASEAMSSSAPAKLHHSHGRLDSGFAEC